MIWDGFSPAQRPPGLLLLQGSGQPGSLMPSSLPGTYEAESGVKRSRQGQIQGRSATRSEDGHCEQFLGPFWRLIHSTRILGFVYFLRNIQGMYFKIFSGDVQFFFQVDEGLPISPSLRSSSWSPFGSGHLHSSLHFASATALRTLEFTRCRILWTIQWKIVRFLHFRWTKNFQLSGIPDFLEYHSSFSLPSNFVKCRMIFLPIW